jgi:hypothetical protein
LLSVGGDGGSNGDQSALLHFFSFASFLMGFVLGKKKIPSENLSVAGESVCVCVCVRARLGVCLLSWVRVRERLPLFA